MAVVDNAPEKPANRASLQSLVADAPPAYWVAGVLLLIMPVFASDFVLYQIFGWTFILGMIALSLMLLGGYGGMISLAQMSIAGIAGYMVAIFGSSAITDISQGWPWFLAIPLALIIAVLFATVTGWLAVRTEGIYTIMITLAICRGVILLLPPELHDIQRVFRFQRSAATTAVRNRLARAESLLLPHTLLGCGFLLCRSVPVPRALRPCIAGCPGQPPPHGSPGLQCDGAPGGCVFLRCDSGRYRRHIAHLAICTDFARARSASGRPSISSSSL